MKTLTKLFAALVLVVFITATVWAQHAGASANATASCTIINPIAVAQTSNLSFGVMAVQTAVAGTCILSTAGVRTATGGVNLPSSGTSGNNAAFAVSGEANTTYAIVLPTNVHIVNGSNSMDINALKARFNGKTVDALTSTLNASGSDSFSIGGTLSVVAAQNVGKYEGTFPVTVAYN